MFTDHQIPLARLDKSRTHEFKYVPQAEKLKALATEIEFRKIAVTSFAGTLKPVDGGVDLVGTLIGQTTQNCVISGAPVHTRLKHEVIRKYRKEIPEFEVDIAHLEDFDDSLEILPANLDLDLLISESILLIAPEYPKHSEYLVDDSWSIATEGFDEVVETERPNPFEGLNEKLFGKKTDKT